MEWDELTAEGLKTNIVEAMESREMQEALERVHSLYTDREKKPVEKAVWWIEYVCRHQGADILQSIGENASFHLQKYGLDDENHNCSFKIYILFQISFFKPIEIPANIVAKKKTR